MTPYDAALVGVIAAGMIWGAFRGITWQVASIASLALGYTVSHTLSGQIAPYFPGDPLVARSLAMLAIYFGASTGVFLVAWIVRATLRQLKFEAFDRYLGMLLGGVEGSILGLVVTLFVVSLLPQTRDPIFNSPSGKLVGQVMAAIGPVLPEEARSVLGPFWSNTGKIADLAPVEREKSSTPSGRDSASVPRDDATTPVSLDSVIQQEEIRIGKAVSENAVQSLRQALGGSPNEGTAKRR